MDTKKTFLIINQTAGSPYHGMVYRNYYIAREWVKEGHRAIIISGSYFHNFTHLPQTNGLFTKEEIDGIEYWWVKMPHYSKSKSMGRLGTLFIFPFLLLFFPFWKLGKPETVIVSSPPHLSIINAWIWSRLWKATLIFEVRDIWPLTIIKLGKVKAWNPLILMLTFFERVAYQVSDHVVSVLALAYRHFESKGMAPEKFAYIPNGVDTSSEAIVESDVSREVAALAEKKTIVLYAGSFGIANNLDQMIDAAILLKDETDLHFVFVGDGPHKNVLIEKAKGLSNVSFMGPVPKKAIPAILEKAHITYVGLMKSDLFRHGVSPNKLFDYMAARKPVIMAIDTEDDIVGKAGCGITVVSCGPADIADAVRKLKAKSPDELRVMGQNGRDYLERNHTYSSLSRKYIRLIEDARLRKLSESTSAFSPFWFGFWFVCIVGFILQIILPHLSPAHFKNGITIFLNDPHYFHDLAVQVAQSPWHDFTWKPAAQFPAGVLAFLYKITGVFSPYVFLPVSAVMAGITIKAITSCLHLLNVRGRWWPLLISIFFTVTPTSISWMVYPHKETFIVPGVFVLLWAFLSVTLGKARVRHFFAVLFGSLLIFSSKPYFAELLLCGIILSSPFILLRRGRKFSFLSRVGFLFFSVLVFATVWKAGGGYTSAGKQAPSESPPAPVEPALPRHLSTRAHWVNTFGGELVNRPLLAMAYTRERFLFERPHGNTNYLPDIHLESAADTIGYIPKALQLAFLEPLPWREAPGETGRKVVFFSLQFEMLLVYASILFLFSSGRKSWNRTVFVCLALAIPFLFAFGMAVPNIGTVNRYRFPFLIIVKMAGLAALWNAGRLRWPGRLLKWVDPPELIRPKKKVLFLVPDDATFVIQRLVMAQGVQREGFDVHVACPDMGHAQKIRELGFTFHELDLNRGGLNPFADFMPFIRLLFFLAKERPDILQCVSIKPVIYGATAGTIVGLKRIVCLVNGLGYAFEGKGIKGKLVLTVAKALYRNALAMPGVRVIFQNPDDQKYFVDAKIVEQEKTLLIRGSGVNMTKFAPTPLPQNTRPVVLFVGRLLWSKGLRELLEATVNLKKEGLDFTVRIVGAPDDRNPEAVPSSYLKSFHDEGTIEWLGRQTDMPRFYRESDIITLPTEYREGLPLTLLEAASTGRPIITTDMPGCREICRNGENGFLVPIRDSEALAKAMRKLIVNPELRKKFGDSSADIVRREFSSEIVQQMLLDVYRGLYSDSPRTAINSVTTA